MKSAAPTRKHLLLIAAIPIGLVFGIYALIRYDLRERFSHDSINKNHQIREIITLIIAHQPRDESSNANNTSIHVDVIKSLLRSHEIYDFYVSKDSYEAGYVQFSKYDAVIIYQTGSRWHRIFQNPDTNPSHEPDLSKYHHVKSLGGEIKTNP